MAYVQDVEKTLGEALDRITWLERELARHEERTEGLSAQETYNRAKLYIDMNPGVWQRIKADARVAAHIGRRFSIAREFEELRDQKWLELNENEQYRCNNSYRACLTRFLMQEVPEVIPFVKWRRSKIDKYFPGLKEVFDGKEAA